MRNPILPLGSLALALAAVAGCHHAPPDLEARAVARPPQVRRPPTESELRGVWISSAVRGAPAALGHTAIYVFGADGRYTGTIAGDDEATPIEGTYRYSGGRLELDGGALVLDAVLVDGTCLELVSQDAFLALTRARPRS